jgi:predicted kinase
MARPGDRSTPTLLLITGLPGTGKSTTADQAAELLRAPVLAHDWAMSGLRPYQELQQALDSMMPAGHQPVGWSILLALARAQIRRGSSVVLDGVARPEAIDRCRTVAAEEGALFLVVLTECVDHSIHRSRIERRQRSIPDWYELDWDHVRRSRAKWDRPESADLILQATESVTKNGELLARLLARTHIEDTDQ